MNWADIIESNLVAELGEHYFLVDCRISAAAKPKITVVIDSDTNVHVDDCAKLSNKLKTIFDPQYEDYTLEVTSPGIDQPITHLRQYKKNIGRTLRVMMQDNEIIVGKLIEWQDPFLLIEVQPKTKKGTTEQEKIDRHQTKKITTQVSFN